MKRKILPGPVGILTLLLVPYLTVTFLNGMKTALLNRRFDGEMALPVIVAAQISREYEPETLKAQTVIVRSNLKRRIENGESFSELLTEAKTMFHPTAFVYRIPPLIYEKAVDDTKGEVLTLNGKRSLYLIMKSAPGRPGTGKRFFMRKPGII